MGAVEFRKFNKVGLNSRPNAFPLLMGKTIEMVTRKPMNMPSVQPDWSYNEHCKRYLDDEPYIPLEYEKLGYKDQPSSFFNDVSFKKFESSPHGSSLLRQFESGIKRTCKTLPIPFQYCICQYEMVAVRDKNLEKTVGKLAVDGLVATLDSHNVSSKCEKISLNQVIAVEKYTLPNENVNFESNLYDVVFNVSKPALGKFKVKDNSYLLSAQPQQRVGI
ncbi:unnamed protein product [Heligmosomoides polygyrus]|uniref:39S ribosomal protein L41, mitochondrial n=1 Tax=Heligmosomoides polygyrus TaxID=6339 RepID=A0A183GCY7_HELPZ|nr:unnamed protein product [Heligmosomoides polygyrus]